MSIYPFFVQPLTLAVTKKEDNEA